MIRARPCRLLLVLLLLGLALGWPLLGSGGIWAVRGAAGAHSAAAAAVAAAPEAGHTDCAGGHGGGYVGGAPSSCGLSCPASLCPVAAAVVPAAPAAPAAGRPTPPGTADPGGQGRVTDVQTPPPRESLPA